MGHIAHLSNLHPCRNMICISFPPFDPIFVIISPLKKTWSFISTNLNSLHPRKICTKFDWIWPAGSEENILKHLSVFLLSHYYLPLEKGYPLHLNKLGSPPGSPRMICAKSGKIGPVVLKKRIFKWPHPIFTFLWLSPLWRGPGPLFEQTWILFIQA